MAREFVVSIGNSTVAGSSTLVLVSSASAPNPGTEFLRFWVGQSANATSAQQRVQIRTQISSWPILASFTPKKLKPSDPNASVIIGGVSGQPGQCGINATSEGAGTTTIVLEDAFNVLNGWLHVPTPAETVVMGANAPVTLATATALELFFSTAPTTLTGWSWGLIFREV